MRRVCVEKLWILCGEVGGGATFEVDGATKPILDRDLWAKVRTRGVRNVPLSANDADRLSAVADMSRRRDQGLAA